MREAPYPPRRIGDQGDDYRLASYRDELMLWLGETIQEAVGRIEATLGTQHEHAHQWHYCGSGDTRTKECSICNAYERAPL